MRHCGILCHQQQVPGKLVPGAGRGQDQHQPTCVSRRCGVADLRERNRVDNRSATVDAAFALFADRGYCHVTVADICDAAGIGRRTFFRYFATKDDVLTEPARQMAAQVAAAITSAPRLPEAQVLRQALTEIAAYALSHRARLHQLAEVRKASADIRWSPLTRLSEQEQALAGQLAARRGGVRTRLADPAAGRPGRGRPARLARRHHRRRLRRPLAAPPADLRHRTAPRPRRAPANSKPGTSIAARRVMRDTFRNHPGRGLLPRTERD